MLYMNHVLMYIKGLFMSFLSTVILILSIISNQTSRLLTLLSILCYVFKHAVQDLFLLKCVSA